MPLFKHEIHVHVHVHGDNDNGDIATELSNLKQFMAENFDELKASVVGLNVKLDTAATATAGLQADVTFLKQLLSDMVNGATAAQIAELQGIVDSIGTKTDGIVTALTTLDAETDPNAPQS